MWCRLYTQASGVTITNTQLLTQRRKLIKELTFTTRLHTKIHQQDNNTPVSHGNGDFKWSQERRINSTKVLEQQLLDLPYTHHKQWPILKKVSHTSVKIRLTKERVERHEDLQSNAPPCMINVAKPKLIETAFVNFCHFPSYLCH